MRENLTTFNTHNMADPLLSSLCSICHINVPKYTCPRCSINTCSLPCSKRHKLWSSCNGTRDPTVFKPKSELATPSGLDHDYNFLHSIEHRIERSEKEIVVERLLVSKEELAEARKGEGGMDWHDQRRRRKINENPGEVCIERMLRQMNTRVERAPKGMSRNVENKTSWSRNHRTINWQVEWILMEGGRVLSKMLGTKPIGDCYVALREELRRRGLSEEERRAEKKRKANDTKQRQAKRMKSDGHGNVDLLTDIESISNLQDPQTTAWNLKPAYFPIPGARELSQQPLSVAHPHEFKLYLLRPHTPSSFPKVLVPLDPAKPLSRILRWRIVLEFPTIYVQINTSEPLSDKFMTEKDFCTAKPGETAPQDSDEDVDSTDDEEDSEDDAEDDGDEDKQDVETTSSSGSDSDEYMEDGEIA